MEEEIEEAIVQKYNGNISINVIFKNFRCYEIKAVIFLDFNQEETISFEYIYDAKFTMSANVHYICEKLDKEIAKIFHN